MRYIFMVLVAITAAILPGSQDSLMAQGQLRDMTLSGSDSGSESDHSQGPLTDKFEYYDDGKVRSCSKMTSSGQLAEKTCYFENGRASKVERYDRDGEKIEEANYDENGALTANVDGWAAKRWEYKDGAMRVESTYGPDGHLTERLIYNSSGDLADRQYVGDGDIDPNEEFNRGVVVTRETDQFFTESGQETGSMTTEVDDPDDPWM